MKKFIYIALLAISTCLMVTSCTEEAVAPKPVGAEGSLSSDKGN